MKIQQNYFLSPQDLLHEVKSQQSEMDKFADEAQTLQTLTSESRVGNFVSQLTSRYQGLLVTTKVWITTFVNETLINYSDEIQFLDFDHVLKKKLWKLGSVIHN